jgi:hypothetical protein
LNLIISQAGPIWLGIRRNRLTTAVSRERLQSAFAKAVKKADPKCEGFVGVIVQRETPKERLDANWAIRGVRYGNADRARCSKALTTLAERMQREFILEPHVPGSTDKPGN